MTKIALVGCSSRKLTEPAPARDLYISSLFQAARDYAETHADRWFILSAHYGLVLPDRIIEPYNTSLAEKSPLERTLWTAQIAQQLTELHLLQDSTVWIFLTGQMYARHLSRYLTMTGTVEQPLTGLRVGQQIAWLKSHTA